MKPHLDDSAWGQLARAIGVPQQPWPGGLPLNRGGAAHDAPPARTPLEIIMKKTWLQRAGYGLLAPPRPGRHPVAALAGYGHLKASRKLEVRLEAVAARSDAVAIERGGYLFRSRG